MGSTLQSDVPGNIHPITHHFASVASNGGAARVAIFKAPQNIRLKSFGVDFYGADKAVTATSYRRLTLVDGGANGTGTTIISSMNLTTSVASMGTASGSIATANQDIDAGDILIFSHLTVGGDHNAGTVLPDGAILVDYELR